MSSFNEQLTAYPLSAGPPNHSSAGPLGLSAAKLSDRTMRRLCAILATPWQMCNRLYLLAPLHRYVCRGVGRCKGNAEVVPSNKRELNPVSVWVVSK